jgi:hypothetical protein
MSVLPFSQMTIGSVDSRINNKKQRPTIKNRSAKKSRHVVWSDSNYECIQRGTPFRNHTDVEALYQTKLLTEAMFYIFRHVNYADMERNATLPVYEAVYWCHEREQYLRVQKCHLKQVYATMRKNDVKNAWSVDEFSGLPYWVDRHLFSKL